MAIDPTARVADGARIEEGAGVGPFCVIGPDVELAGGVRLLAHVHVTGVTSIGEGTIVYPFASLGTPPQSTHYRGGATRLIIGARCEVREGVTMNKGTEAGGGLTRIGDRCTFMVGAHVAHDCQVGNDVTFANAATLGGHVSVGDHTFLGGLAAVHQFRRIGESAMIGGLEPVRADVIPFGLVRGGNLRGLNVVGLRRRGAKRADTVQLQRAYRALFFGAGVFADRIDAVARDFADDPFVGKIIAFIRAGGRRPLLHPRGGGEDDERDDDAA